MNTTYKDTAPLIKSTGKKETGVLFKISAPMLSTVAVTLPSFAFFICIILSLVYDFEASTATHCHVRNYLPSISATIGGFTPQRYIWRISIALHSAPRILFALIYRNYHLSFRLRSTSNVYAWVVNFGCFCTIVENLSLVSLTYVSSSENYNIHEASFILFMLTSELYMVISCLVFYWARKHRNMIPREKKSMKYKIILTSVNISSFFLVVYFFFRHNEHCEPGVYTMFALFEYIVVASNIMFHGFSQTIDLPDIRIHAG